MAPRDDKKQPLVWNAPPAEEEEEEEQERQVSKSSGWKQRLVVRLRQWLELNPDENESSSLSSLYGSFLPSGNNKLKLVKVAKALLIVSLAVTLYKSKRSNKLKRKVWAVLLALASSSRPDYNRAVDVSLSVLRAAAANGLISKALVGPEAIVFQEYSSSGGWKRSKLPPNSPSIQSDFLDLLSQGGCPDVSSLPESLSSRLATPVLTALPFVYLALMYKVLKSTMNGGNDIQTLSSSNTSQTTRFSDVAGLDPIMGEVHEIVRYLQNPSYFHALGAEPPRGVLLHGPPGSGKTLLAQAVAGEADCDAFLACSGSDFCEMYVGRGAARVRSLFERARSTATYNQSGAYSWWPWNKMSSSETGRNATAILFIDEFDALAKSRSYGGLQSNDERDQTLNQLLTEMDGFSSQQNQVTIIVIAATNRADVLDPAILRRFDRQIHVPYPDAKGRAEILKIHARRTRCQMDSIDWDHLASMTNNFSGSELRNLVNDAALLAVRNKSLEVDQAHLVHAARRARAMKDNSDLMGGTFQSHLFYASPPGTGRK